MHTFVDAIKYNSCSKNKFVSFEIGKKFIEIQLNKFIHFEWIRKIAAEEDSVIKNA